MCIRDSFVIHLGDVVAPATINFFKGIRMMLIRGNCDGDTEMIKKRCVELGFEYHDTLLELEMSGKRIAGAHGHDSALLDRLVRSGKYDYVLFGHTHEKTDRVDGKTRVINPGAHYYTTKEKTVAILDPAADSLTFIRV